MRWDRIQRWYLLILSYNLYFLITRPCEKLMWNLKAETELLGNNSNFPIMWNKLSTSGRQSLYTVDGRYINIHLLRKPFRQIQMSTLDCSFWHCFVVCWFWKRNGLMMAGIAKFVCSWNTTHILIIWLNVFCPHIVMKDVPIMLKRIIWPFLLRHGLDFSVYCMLETKSLDYCGSTDSVLVSRFWPSVTGSCS